MWAVLAALVLYHEIACDEGELLSEAVDRGLDRHPWIIRVFAIVTVAHLLNWLPRNIDPYAWVGKFKKENNG